MKCTTQAVALWGRKAPSHSITTMMITDDQKTIVTGSSEGQICLWYLSVKMEITSKAILFGHTTPVTCLAKAREFEKQPYVVSSSENGEMCIWNVANGHCIQNSKLPFRHTAICYYHCSFRMTGEGWLLCCGQYQDVLIVDAKTLQVLHTLKSQSSEWISCMCIVHSTRIQEDSLVAMSVVGDLKVWDLSSSVNSIQEKQNVSETETKSLDVTNCCAVRFCMYTERLLLVICSSSWKVYDYCDFSLLCTDNCKSGQSFVGGEFLAANRLIIWTVDGHSYIYQLLNSGLPKSIYPTEGGLLKETITPQLLCSTSVQEKSFSCFTGFLNERKEPFFKILYSGNSFGRISFWHIPDVPVSQNDGSPGEIEMKTTVTLQEMFDRNKSMSEGIIDHIRIAKDDKASAAVTASIYIPNLDKLVCGCEDGKIVVTIALHAARARLLEDHQLLNGSVPHKIFDGHNCSVSSLLYPHRRSEKFDPSWLLSGDQNSMVIWRDVFTGEIFHKFMLQSGSILKILVPPDDYKVKMFQSIYCMCSDNSVALLNLQERVCFFHARKHLFPVKTMKWHPVEEVLIVGCEDGSAYVWEIETGTLERHETGEMAKAILNSCEDFNIEMTDSIVTFSQETQRATQATFKPSNSYKLGTLSHNLMHPEKWANKNKDTGNSTQPFTVIPVRCMYNVILHLLLFDLEKVLELLQTSQANGLKSANSFHSYDALKTAKSSSEKRPLTLKRNKTAGSLCQIEGNVSEPALKEIASRSGEEGGGIKRHKKFKSSKKVKTQSSRKIDVNMVMDASKLLLSCLLPWGVDKEFDHFCTRHLEIPQIQGSVTFGMISGNHHVGIMLPGWNKATNDTAEEHLTNILSKKVMELSTKYSVAKQKQNTKKEIQGNHRINTINMDTLFFLQKLFVVNKSLNMETFSKFKNRASSQEKMESVRGKWKSSEHFSSSLANFTVEVIHDRNGSNFPDAENVSVMKIVSSWKDQSVQVTEAMQAVLLAEVKSKLESLRQTIIITQPVSVTDNGCPLPSSKIEPSESIELQLIKENTLQTPGSFIKNESGSKSVNFQEPDKSTLEDSDSPDDMKQNPWMSKMCYCKVC
ncbi:WD repeat-containing protein 72 [Spea bombifrons]|uniref:WD repeat-containing protein 72 n=1 Tax=Spea bombifrons TaxID=233779 RepID=UPI00234A148C|nr:WD repeat-containing protein 72 [Spea bombifrons]XP_053318495.1 WD repeat-containing protein 72 [Spea bombifrons]